jgi:hypothetical protein
MYPTSTLIHQKSGIGQCRFLFGAPTPAATGADKIYA